MNIYLKLEVGFPENPRVAQLGVEAESLYVRGLLYCKRNLVDGFLAETVVHRVAHEGTTHLAGAVDQLVAAGLWTVVDGGWQIHDWTDRNATRAEIDAKRDAAAARKAAYRDKKTRDRMSQRDTVSRDAVSPTYRDRDRDRERAGNAPSPSTISADDYPGIDVPTELVKFEHWTKAHGKVHADPHAAALLWLARAWRTPTADVIEMVPGPKPRPDCDACGGTGWALPDGKYDAERCACLTVAAS